MQSSCADESQYPSWKGMLRTESMSAVIIIQCTRTICIQKMHYKPKMNSALRYLLDYISKSFDSSAPSRFYPDLKRKKKNLALEKTCCKVFVNFTTSWENSDLKGGWLFRVGSPQRPCRLNDQIIHPLCNAFGKIIE